MELLSNIFITPFADMIAAPDFLMQVIWEGLVSGVLYALIALGFVLIFRSSRIFNFAQGIMVVFAALTLVGLHEAGLPAWISFVLTLGVMFLLEALDVYTLSPSLLWPVLLLALGIGVLSGIGGDDDEPPSPGIR